jgi:hypothetical protein
MGVEGANVTGDHWGDLHLQRIFHRDPLRQIAGNLIRLGGPVNKAKSRRRADLSNTGDGRKITCSCKRDGAISQSAACGSSNAFM